ncbi:hypothetical protein [Streptococcus gordonii]|jgi:hypothetical protein|uniref:hypothetical protein n=3 Tax=Streptococcus gordonii TaxID=1302 RepID=UPI001C8CC147|nr:hypothetical protein [Streptococcus gordonii]MBX9097181.1 hypothetical protein [Streptococcus gordonii]
MKSTELNMTLTLITFILFIIYVAIKSIRNHIIRPTFSIINNIYNDFYDVYFKDVSNSQQYLFLGEIYSTMSIKFEESSISDDDVKKYIDYLDKGSRQYWFLPVISALASLLGIRNMESLLKLVSEREIFNLRLDNKIISLVISLVLLMFIIVFSNKTMSGNNFYRNTRNSWKKSILQDYIDFPKSNVKFDLCKLQESRKILDFLSCFTLKSKNKKIKFKEDNLIEVLENNQQVEYNKPFNYSEKLFTIIYKEKKYLIKIKLMDDNRNIKIIPVNANNDDNNMSESDEFKKLCEIKNNRVKAMSERSYTIPLLGWFYKKFDSYGKEEKKLEKLGITVLYFASCLFISILVIPVFLYGGVFMLLFLAVYIFSDFLITKIFGN